MAENIPVEPDADNTDEGTIQLLGLYCCKDTEFLNCFRVRLNHIAMVG